jgi:lipopolysaccharide heptosyltransferase II
MKKAMKKLYLLGRKTVLLPLMIGSRSPLSVPADGSAIRRILFIRIDRLGDLVLSTPAIEALKKRYPASELTVLAAPVTAPLLACNPHADRIVLYDRAWPLTRRIGVIRELRDSRFDLVVDPYDDWEVETAVIAGWTASPIRVGFAVGGREAFFNVRLREPEPGRHLTDVVLESLAPLGIAATETQPAVYLTEDEKHRARNWLRDRIGENRIVIGLHPGAHYESQRWPADYFKALTAKLACIRGTAVAVFGGPGEKALVESIAEGAPGPVETFVGGDVRRFAALISCCRVLVCNNSGPLHLAGALRVPTVSFMGPTVKSRWFPKGELHRVLRMDDLPCIGCNEGSCPTGKHDCMRLITPAEIMDVLSDRIFEPDGILGQRGPS